MLMRLIRAAAIPFALLLIVVAFFWPIVLTYQFSWLEGPDMVCQVIPWFQMQARLYHTGHIPLWDPFLFGGQSLFGQMQPGAAYPLNWILFSLPLDHGTISFTALNWYFVIIHYIAALFCYLLCRDLGRTRIASLLAGVSFGLGGYMISVDWPQMLNGAVWGPLVLLFLLRVVRGVRPIASAGLAGVVLGVSWLSGHHQIPIFLTLAASGIWLYVLIERRSALGLRVLISAAALFAVLAIFTSALQTFPAYEYSQHAVRWVGTQHDPLTPGEPVPYYIHMRYSVAPIHLLGLVVRGAGPPVSVYLGLVALTLASIAIAGWWREPAIRILLAVAIAGVLLALGKSDIFHGILYSALPMFEKARDPQMAIYLMFLGVAPLLAFGVDGLFLESLRGMVRRFAIGLAGLSALLSLIVFTIAAARRFEWGSDDRIVITIVAAFALSALMFLAARPDSSRRWIEALIVAVYLFDLGSTATMYPNRDDPQFSFPTRNYAVLNPIAQFLNMQQQPVRAEVSVEDKLFNFGDWFGIDTSTGIVPMVQANAAGLDFLLPASNRLYGVRYTVSRKPMWPGQREIWRDSSGIAVYENADVLPRIWTVHQVVQVKTLDEAKARLNDASVQQVAFGYAPPPAVDKCEGDTIRSFRRGINGADAMVDMRCRGMVVMSENNAPGWTAKVDGQPVPIYEAYTVLRGIVVGPGRHTIETRYRPMSVLAGAVCTFAGFLTALGLLAWPSMRRGSR